MELVLLILKIILIAFAALLGLVVLLLGLVLFVPIKYEVSGSVSDGWEIRVKGKVTYLLSLIKVVFAYEQKQFDWKLFIFGFQKKIAPNENESETDTSELSGEENEIFTPSENKSELSSDTITKQEDEKTIEQLEHIETQKKQTIVENAGEIEARVIDSTEQSRRECSDNLKKSQKRLKNEKQKSAKNKFDFAFIKQQLTDAHNQSVLRKFLSELSYMIRHFKFRKIVTDLVFATGDPATTGQTLGILAMIPTLYQYHFKIMPDFEADEAYIKGTFLVAGKIRLIHVLMAALRLIFDKEVRIVVKKFLR